MRSFLPGIIYILSSLFVSSCSPAIYTTMSPVTLLPEKKGDAEIELGSTIYSSAYTGNFGISLTGAYALSDHYLATANYLGWCGDVDVNTVANAPLLDFENWGSRAKIFEVGVGRYWMNRKDNNWRYELTGGYGMGFINNERQDGAWTDTQYTNFYAQPALGYKSKHLWLITSLKLNYINFRSLDWQYPDAQDERVHASFYHQHQRTLAVEPGVNLSLHHEPIVISAKYTWSSFDSAPLGERRLPLVMNRNFTISFMVRLNLLRKRRGG